MDPFSSLFTSIILGMTITIGVILLNILPASIFPITFISLLACTMFGFERVGLGQVGKTIDNTLYNSVVLVYNAIIAADNATWNITSKMIEMGIYIIECIVYPFEYIETKVARLFGMQTRYEREAEMMYMIARSGHTSATNPLDIIKWIALVYISIMLYTFFK